MLNKLHVLVTRVEPALWEARIIEADFLTRARGTSLTMLFKELYDLIGAHIEGALNVGQEPFAVGPASDETRAAFYAAGTRIEWLNKPAWKLMPELEVRIGNA